MELAGENVMVAVFGMGEDAGRGERAAARRAARRGRATSEQPATPRAGAVRAAAAVGRARDDAARGVPRARRRSWRPRDAVGRVAAESLAAYPPGIPNVLPGERLTAETLDYIEQTIAHGGSLRGASDRALRTLRVAVEQPTGSGHALAADRLHQAVGAAAAERERGELGVVHGQARARAGARSGPSTRRS